MSFYEVKQKIPCLQISVMTQVQNGLLSGSAKRALQENLALNMCETTITGLIRFKKSANVYTDRYNNGFLSQMHHKP